MTPDGKIRWSYRNPARPPGRAASGDRRGDEPFRNERFRSSAGGIMTSALVTDDTVYFGDLDGWFYALDRANGAEWWKVNTRAADFPGAHPFNVIFASPILADGRVIFGGGTLEQTFARTPSNSRVSGPVPHAIRPGSAIGLQGPLTLRGAGGGAGLRVDDRRPTGYFAADCPVHHTSSTTPPRTTRAPPRRPPGGAGPPAPAGQSGDRPR